MIVRDLIQILSGVPDALPVVIQDADEGSGTLLNIQEVKLDYKRKIIVLNGDYDDQFELPAKE